MVCNIQKINIILIRENFIFVFSYYPAEFNPFLILFQATMLKFEYSFQRQIPVSNFSVIVSSGKKYKRLEIILLLSILMYVMTCVG
jgi:hypothetical protein